MAERASHSRVPQESPNYHRAGDLKLVRRRNTSQAREVWDVWSSPFAPDDLVWVAFSTVLRAFRKRRESVRNRNARRRLISRVMKHACVLLDSRRAMYQDPEFALAASIAFCSNRCSCSSSPAIRPVGKNRLLSSHTHDDFRWLLHTGCGISDPAGPANAGPWGNRLHIACTCSRDVIRTSVFRFSYWPAGLQLFKSATSETTLRRWSGVVLSGWTAKGLE